MLSSPVDGKRNHILSHISRDISHSYNIHATVCSRLQKSLLSQARPEAEKGKEQHLHCFFRVVMNHCRYQPQACWQELNYGHTT